MKTVNVYIPSFKADAQVAGFNFDVDRATLERVYGTRRPYRRKLFCSDADDVLGKRNSRRPVRDVVDAKLTAP